MAVSSLEKIDIVYRIISDRKIYGKSRTPTEILLPLFRFFTS
ncbi:MULTISPECIES: hypothetical protein [Nostocales]|uniref:Transposase n=1 Tax=Tolypothrix campylonemoides VB511288_2 TaxID=3232311 RepID=A0ABW8XB16_9CYAN|nr:hypothetical protein [Tolypothrix bouteillei]